MSNSPQKPASFPAGSLRRDGGRNYVHPADVKGRFTTGRHIFFAILFTVYTVLPWVKIAGHPAVFLDIQHRQFFIFGGTFNAQDTWLLFFFLSGLGFTLIFATAVLGRLWCGYACPQTVFLEGIYRPIERWIEGPRSARLKRNAGPWNKDKIWRKALKHFLFITVSMVVANIFVSYFVSLPRLFDMMQHGPAMHSEAFVWMATVAAVMFFNFAWFREQLCLVVCPYGRLQSVLIDNDSLVIGYDEQRGETRGKKSDPAAGDCIDCKRCVTVCPTGIDIRNGQQLECIGCAACIDACDAIMDKVKRPRGLVRYDSLSGLEGKPKRFLRPRLYFYTLLGIVGLSVAVTAASQRTRFEANILRLQSGPYIIENDTVRNAWEIHLQNKTSHALTFTIAPQEGGSLRYIIPIKEITLEPLTGGRLPVFVTLPLSAVDGSSKHAELLVSTSNPDIPAQVVRAVFNQPPAKRRLSTP